MPIYANIPNYEKEPLLAVETFNIQQCSQLIRLSGHCLGARSGSPDQNFFFPARLPLPVPSPPNPVRRGGHLCLIALSLLPRGAKSLFSFCQTGFLSAAESLPVYCARPRTCGGRLAEGEGGTIGTLVMIVGDWSGMSPGNTEFGIQRVPKLFFSFLHVCRSIAFWLQIIGSRQERSSVEGQLLRR